MARLYLGRYQWRLTPPLEIHQYGAGRLAVFVPQADWTPQAKDLLEKIISSVGIPAPQATIALVRGSLTQSRLMLFSEPVLWVMGRLIPTLKVGAYDLRAGKAVSPPTGFPDKGAYLYILPGLNEMLADAAMKKTTWQWIRSLASKS